MKIKSLHELAHVNFQLKGNFRSYNLIQLQQERVQQRRIFDHLQHKTVAIHGDVEHMVRCMFLLDGFVKALVIVPAGSCSQFVDGILDEIELDAVLIDESVDFSIWPEGLSHALPASLPVDISYPPNDEIDSEWLISTSGTTGIAKMVKHSFNSLCRPVTQKKNNNLYTWGLLYDPARFAGIQVILQAIIGGASLVVSDTKSSLIECVDNFSKNSVTALSGTPTMWRRLLMIEKTTNLDLEQITLGGEISDRRILKSLRESFPRAHITHIYASTEAGVGFAVHDGKEGFPLTWTIRSGDCATLKISERCTLMIRTLGASQKYVNGNDEIFNEDGWHDTGDLVEVVGERVEFRGRINGSINVGGNKVMPEEVERHIEELEFVSRSIVRARQSSIVGNLLEASVVLSMDIGNHKAVIKKILLHCTSHLAPYKVPAFIKVVDELPMSTSGKLNRS